MSDPMSLEQRMDRLEDIAFEGDGLKRSVDRLGLNASALGEALLTVDRNQQRLTQLGQELEETKANSATKEEVEAQAALQRATLVAYRKKVLARAYTIVIIATAVVAGLTIGVANYVQHQNDERYELCLGSNARGQAVQDYLSTVAANSTNPQIRASAQKTIDQFPISDCEALR